LRNTNNYLGELEERIEKLGSTIDSPIKERAEIWNYFYHNKFNKINIIQGSKYELLWLLVKESIEDYSKLKNDYIERKLRFNYVNYYKKFSDVPFKSSELIHFYDVRIKYSFMFFFNFIYEGFFIGLTNICFDLYKFISSTLWSPITSLSMYPILIESYYSLKTSLYNLGVKLIKDFINVFIHDLYYFLEKTTKLILFYSKLVYSETKILMYDIYVHPIKEEFNIDIRSIYKRNFSDFFISFFYFEEKISFKEFISLIKFIYKQSIFGLKKLFISIYDLSKPYIGDLNIYLKIKTRPFTKLYFKELSNRVDEIEIIYNKYIPIKVKEFNYLDVLLSSTEGLSLKENIILSAKLIKCSFEIIILSFCTLIETFTCLFSFF